MNRVRSLGLAQRIVLVVALAGALRIVAQWLLVESGPSGGWFGYPPDNFTLTMSNPQRFSDLVTLLVSLAFVAAWAAVSVWLLAPAPPATDEAR